MAGRAWVELHDIYMVVPDRTANIRQVYLYLHATGRAVHIIIQQQKLDLFQSLINFLREDGSVLCALDAS